MLNVQRFAAPTTCLLLALSSTSCATIEEHTTTKKSVLRTWERSAKEPSSSTEARAIADGDGLAITLASKARCREQSWQRIVETSTTARELSGSATGIKMVLGTVLAGAGAAGLSLGGDPENAGVTGAGVVMLAVGVPLLLSGGIDLLGTIDTTEETEPRDVVVRATDSPCAGKPLAATKVLVHFTADTHEDSPQVDTDQDGRAFLPLDLIADGGLVPASPWAVLYVASVDRVPLTVAESELRQLRDLRIRLLTGQALALARADRVDGAASVLTRIEALGGKSGGVREAIDKAPTSVRRAEERRAAEEVAARARRVEEEAAAREIRTAERAAARKRVVAERASEHERKAQASKDAAARAAAEEARATNAARSQQASRDAKEERHCQRWAAAAKDCMRHCPGYVAGVPGASELPRDGLNLALKGCVFLCLQGRGFEDEDFPRCIPGT